MKPPYPILARFAAAVAMLNCLGAVAALQPNPYAGITRSNVFRLHQPPPAQPGKPEVQPPPFPKVFITGLFELRGVSLALLEFVQPGQPVQRPILAAGGTIDGLQVLQIDVPGERVRVRWHGTEETLNIEKAKPSTGPPPVPALRPAGVIRG